ncbi:two-component system, chemotaxis family, response regulator WspF [Mariprofundus ferrinatatus]|uniref:Protein-glutamate methylesterase/protein-glutamine glutaminase n=1 Tax=Mariprofundus ferrinatatus TaxID=1921087 RepID=A0A2K8L635_9PROT|nr:chemotaxis response regulator protein-glutamate methylesterase [Mariprofundus ferrinatatus]ATX82703.1 two-component system, chemotaxis family, response regulator WspF [Mariprofundus ferrinatatus]
MRIGIVNDVPMVQELLRRIISKMSGHEVAWLASDGEEAIAKCSSDKPDLVLMDLIMPGINGVEATRRIMQESPCLIMVVTASVEANQGLAFDAISAGAIDVVKTPEAVMESESGPFQKKINNISRIIGNGNVAADGRSNGKTGIKTRHDEVPSKDAMLIGIGASTGGPAALVEVLKTLPASFPAALVVVVHVDEEFAPGMAEWMGGQINLPVHLVREGERPKAGEVLFAATNEHLVLNHHQRFHYTAEPVECHYRPSVDAFFSSLALNWRGDAIGVLLTGMGRDGAKGLKSMREHGWLTIAQDEESSAIYGMPKAAAMIGAAVKILPLDKIGPELVRKARK